MMTTFLEYRNKYENQYVKKRNRKKSPSKSVRKWRQTHGRSTNSLKRPSNDSAMRQKRMIQMKYNKDICHHLTKDDIDYMTDDMISIQYNSIPIWNCQNCNYTNIERGLNCKICDSTYTYTHSQASNHITLGQFFEDEWLSSSIPVWICSQCTCCNIEQLSFCQICEYPYDYQAEIDEEDYCSFSKKKNKKRKQNKKSKSTQTEWNCPQCTLINSGDATKCILCDYEKISNKASNQNSIMNSSKHKYDITVQLKLNTNCWFHDVKSFKIHGNINNNSKYYGISECNLIMQNAKNNHAMSYILVPTTAGRSSNYKALPNVVVPIGGSNNPLKSIASLAWSSRFNRFNTIKPKWNKPKISELNTLNFCHGLLEILMQFIPSYDICKAVLFEYVQIFLYILDIPDGCLTKYKQDNGEWCDAKIVQHKKSVKISKYSDAWWKLPLSERDRVEGMIAVKIEQKTWWGHWLPAKWVNFTVDMMCFCGEECDDDMHVIKDNKGGFSFYCDVSRKYVVTIDGSILLNQEDILDVQNNNDNKIKLFMKHNNGKFPFRLFDTKLSSIRERYYDTFHCFEIGFNKHDI